jgi:GAF domain-containing protein
VPIIRDGKVMGVLDVDSEELAAFDAIDKRFLEEVVDCIIFE